jgi:selenocysteine lyase/cysteine desulfurase
VERGAGRHRAAGAIWLKFCRARVGVESTARASFCFYNTKAEVDRFVEVVKEIQKFFAQ